jgi:hypothetical protein
VSASSAFDTLCDQLERFLGGPAREEIAAEAAAAGTLERALLAVRPMMRSHVWRLGANAYEFARPVEKFDRKTRQIGFHALNDWDGIADRVNDDTIPVDVLHYLIDRRGGEPASPLVIAVLIDYYVMHLLGLLSLRVWDEGDPDANLDRVGALLELLQGSGGSGQPFASDAETLLLIATSHYEMYERGYAVLLEQVQSLNRRHQVHIARGHAASMGCHLRFGFEATYGRDTINMRDDNVADYPWLLYALGILMEEYVRLRQSGDSEADHDVLVEALVNGLSGDARAFVGKPPGSLSAFEPQRAAFRDTFQAYRADLLESFERFRPSDRDYSPLNFFFNFSHNVVKGTTIDALLEKRPRRVTFNALLTSREEKDGDNGDKLALARTLMDYARANPQTIRGRPMPVIVYDPFAGRQAFSVAMRKLRE